MNPENSKPEWFQMAQEDGFAPKSTPKRAIRIMALSAPLLVLGAGFVFAQGQDSPTASASPAAVSTAAATDPISLSITPTPATPATTPASNPVHVSQANTTSAPNAAITIKKPAITKPTSGGEDDGLVRSSDDD